MYNEIGLMIKFYVRLQENVTEVFNRLTQAYRDQVLSQVQIAAETFFLRHTLC